MHISTLDIIVTDEARFPVKPKREVRETLFG